ncbi:MAG: hypothetical protein IJY14_02545 [Acholeplasmatales bacterium]|nr:hypothetical protein [Acholeplasmatales bacterium]
MYNLYNPNINKNMPCYRGIAGDDNRSLLLPFLVGAAVAFPIGYIASNTKNNQGYYQAPPQYYAPYPQPYPYNPYYMPTYR